MKYKHTKPRREQLCGMSPSEFKIFLKRRGIKVPRAFFKAGSVAQQGNRMLRFRWWSPEFVVDISCAKPLFDRWANSVDKSVSAHDWMKS